MKYRNGVKQLVLKKVYLINNTFFKKLSGPEMWQICAAMLICQAGHIATWCTNCPKDCDINGKCYTCPEKCENCTHISSSRFSCDTCKPGYYGPRCNKICSHNFQERKCNIYNGVCSKGCVVGYYGYKCDAKCSTGCEDKDCNEDNGVCSKGCVIGFHGHFCNVSCSKTCLHRECRRLTGTCTHGCIEGYYGETCHLCHNDTKGLCFVDIPPTYHHSIVPQITGWVLGGIILVATAVASILLVRRKCKRRTHYYVNEDTDRRYDGVLDMSSSDPTHSAVDEGRMIHTSYRRFTVRTYFKDVYRSTDDPAHNPSMDMERGTYETLCNPDYDDDVHVYNSTVLCLPLTTVDS